MQTDSRNQEVKGPYHRWLSAVSAALVCFAGLTVAWQIRHGDREKALQEWAEHGRDLARDNGIVASLYQSWLRGRQLAAVSDLVKRDQLVVPASGLCRYLDLVLPENGRVFMPDMTGPTNYDKVGNYFFLTYYLFPRKVGVSIDQPTHLGPEGFPGRTAVSDQEMLSNGYDAVVTFPGDTVTLRLLRPLREFPLKEPVNPVWLDSNYDRLVAGLLPLLTALAGMWLLRCLFPALREQMPLAEQLAYSLGLGMMVVAAFTLGIKLCGGHGYHLLFPVTAAGAAAELWRNRQAYGAGLVSSAQAVVRQPVTGILLAAGLIVFVILFRLAGLQGLVDPDAMRWALKAKMIHLGTGNGLVQWFSDPALAYAHPDYPTLVPSLHAATYDALGHVNEFVTKFWPTWMLCFLLAALAAANRGGKGRWHAPGFGLLGLLLLPAVQRCVQMEGATLPMIFFTVLGFRQCALWLTTQDRVRLGLGLTLLFGAAMTKLEGFIFFACAGGGLLMAPSVWRGWRPGPYCLRVAVFWALAALPFAWLRLHLSVVQYESSWASYALQHPQATLSTWPAICLIILARSFVSPDFARWDDAGGHFHWIGRWDGVSSLYNNYATLGLTWFCLFIAVALWFNAPDRRRVVLWMMGTLAGAMAALGLIFASFVKITSLTDVINYTNDEAVGRYLLPLWIAWFATAMSLFFQDQTSPDPACRANLNAAGEKAA